MKTKTIQSAVDSLAEKTTLVSTPQYIAFQEAASLEATTYNETNFLSAGLDVNFSSKIKISNEVSISISYGGQTYDISTASTGVKTLISMMLKGINSTSTQKLYLLDEIDAFLHPQWIKLISILIRALLISNKVIIVTHNQLLLSLLAEEHFDLITTIEKTINPDGSLNDGELKEINWDFIIDNQATRTKEQEYIINNNSNAGDHIPPQSTNTPGEISIAKSLIGSNLNQDICRMFFENNPKFVEGPTEKIFFSSSTINTIISGHGFYQYPLISDILKEFGTEPKFLMDLDVRKDGTTKPLNEYVYLYLVSENTTSRVMRLTTDFDFVLSGSAASSSAEKIKNSLFKKSNPSSICQPSVVASIRTFLT